MKILRIMMALGCTVYNFHFVTAKIGQYYIYIYSHWSWNQWHICYLILPKFELSIFEQTHVSCVCRRLCDVVLREQENTLWAGDNTTCVVPTSREQGFRDERRRG